MIYKILDTKLNKTDVRYSIYQTTSYTYNCLFQREIFSTLFEDFEQKKIDNFEDDLHKVREYFSQEGGIPFQFMEEYNVFENLFYIANDLLLKLPNLFNLSFEIINQIILHSIETVDNFHLGDFSLIDLLIDILKPFFNEDIICYNSFIPEMFEQPAFNNITIDISINIFWCLCSNKKKIDILYKNHFLVVLSNILRMRTTDNLIRDCQIVECLSSILLRPSSTLLSKVSDCHIVFQAYYSVFERFIYDQSCIIVIADIYRNLSEILEKEISAIILFYQNGLYRHIPEILVFIFTNNIDSIFINDILYFIAKSLSIDADLESDQGDDDNQIADLIGSEYHISNFYGYILNTTVERIKQFQEEPKCLFSHEEELTLCYIFDCLEQLMMIKNSSIIGYKGIDEVFEIIKNYGKMDLKKSLNNFLLGLIQNLPNDQFHSFLNLGFMKELFESYISSDAIDADFVIDAIYNILKNIEITNPNILRANDTKSEFKNEKQLVLQTFPEVLESFLDYEDSNQDAAKILLNKYYSAVN